MSTWSCVNAIDVVPGASSTSSTFHRTLVISESASLAVPVSARVTVYHGEARVIAWLRGYLAYRDGRYDVAERELDVALGPDVELLSEHFARDAALETLGWTYLETGMLAEAAGVAKRMRELKPRDSRSAALLAKVELARGRTAPATECATGVLAAASAFDDDAWLDRRAHESAAATAALVLAGVALLGGDAHAARTSASDALARARTVYAASDVALFEPIVVMAKAAAERDAESAEQLFREALTLRCRSDHPKRTAALRAYAAFLRTQQRDDEAAAAEAEADLLPGR